MARGSQSFVLELPVQDARDAVKRALAGGNWDILEEDISHILAREETYLFSRAFKNPCKVGIIMLEQSDTETHVELRCAVFGFGPLPNRQIRKTLTGLKEAIINHTA